MSLQFFPSGFRGLSWSSHKSPKTSTLLSEHRSGRKVSAQLYAYPLYSFELNYQVLHADTRRQELQQMMGFFIDRGGRAQQFLYQDPDDFITAEQLLGAGNGSRTDFRFIHPIGTIGAPVGQVETTGLNVYLGDTLQTLGSDYSVVMPNILRFASPVPPLVQVTADYIYYFLCRFDDDLVDYEQFMAKLWSLGSCKFSSEPA